MFSKSRLHLIERKIPPTVTAGLALFLDGEFRALLQAALGSASPMSFLKAIHIVVNPVEGFLHSLPVRRLSRKIGLNKLGFLPPSPDGLQREQEMGQAP
jgi:hypothetical protein